MPKPIEPIIRLGLRLSNLPPPRLLILSSMMRIEEPVVVISSGPIPRIPAIHATRYFFAEFRRWSKG